MDREFADQIFKATDSFIPDPVDMELMFRFFFTDYLITQITRIDKGMLEDESEFPNETPSHVHPLLRNFLHTKDCFAHEYRE